MRIHLVLIVVTAVILLIAYFVWRHNTRQTAEVDADLQGYWGAIKEKRHSIRFAQRIAVECSLAKKENSVHRLFSKDISGEGICLELGEMLPEGANLGLKLLIPNEKPLELKGEVVWVAKARVISGSDERRFEAGVRFTKISPQAKDRLLKFLASIAG